MAEFPILMKFLRERKGVSARNLSAASGLSLSYISKMENGTVIPSVEVFAKVVDNLEITDAELTYIIRSFITQNGE